MLYFSSLLKHSTKYCDDVDNLFTALHLHKERFDFINGTKNIWARDYMPVKSRSGKYVSFRYEPSYLKKYLEERSDFRRDIVSQFTFPVIYSHINLDGGNIVFSPSKKKVVISDRVFSENMDWDKTELVVELSKVLEAEVIIIESLVSDFTGHADGMIRFLTDDTVLINKTELKNGLEQRQARELKRRGFQVIEFPYYQRGGVNAEGTYLNYLETATHIFLPAFGNDMDFVAFNMASDIFTKKVVSVDVKHIPKDGGVFNCISWEN